MQISPASLLVAQQQAPQRGAAQPSAFGALLTPNAAPEKKAFEPMSFAKAETPPAPERQAQVPAQPQAYARPGSTLDIRI